MIHTIGVKNSFTEQEFFKLIFMKKILFILAFLVSNYSISQSSTAVITTNVNVRWEPSIKSRIIKTFSKGKIVDVLQTKGSWSFIKDPENKKKGWVSSRYIEFNIKIIKKNANVRTSPGGRILKQIQKGQLVAVLMEKGNWKFVRDLSNNKKGWVHQSLLSASTASQRIIAPRSKADRSTPSKKIKPEKAPNCDYKIITPSNGDQNVSIDLTIRWNHASGIPNGYYFSLGDNPDGDNLKKSINIGYVTSFTINNLKPKTKYYVSLIPYNDIGLASCDGVFSFTTGNGRSKYSEQQSINLIENRMKTMGLLSKWKRFRDNTQSNFLISDMNTFLITIKSYLGVPYKYGGSSKAGIDCSGLVYRGLKSVGYSGDRLNAESVAKLGKLIANKESLQIGDFVCFSISRGSQKLINHIGIYTGNDKFIHAPSSGKTVQYGNINDPFYWNNKFIFGVRLNNSD